MSGILYTLQFNGVAITAVQDLFQIEAVTLPIAIHEIKVTQRLDVGDSEAEALLIRQKNKITNAVTDDLAAAAVDGYFSGVANLSNLAINETSQIATGAVIGPTEEWTIQQPYHYIYTPETRPIIAVGDAWVLDLAVAPVDSITGSGFVVFSEGISG